MAATTPTFEKLYSDIVASNQRRPEQSQLSENEINDLEKEYETAIETGAEPRQVDAALRIKLRKEHEIDIPLHTYTLNTVDIYKPPNTINVVVKVLDQAVVHTDDNTNKRFIVDDGTEVYNLKITESTTHSSQQCDIEDTLQVLPDTNEEPTQINKNNVYFISGLTHTTDSDRIPILETTERTTATPLDISLDEKLADRQTIRGRVTGVEAPSGLIYRCKEDTPDGVCNNVYNSGDGGCPTHGSTTEVTPDLFVKLHIDTGTDVKRVRGEQKTTQKILGYDVDHAVATMRTDGFEQIRTDIEKEIIGKYVTANIKHGHSHHFVSELYIHQSLKDLQETINQHQMPTLDEMETHAKNAIDTPVRYQNTTKTPPRTTPYPPSPFVTAAEINKVTHYIWLAEDHYTHPPYAQYPILPTGRYAPRVYLTGSIQNINTNNDSMTITNGAESVRVEPAQNAQNEYGPTTTYRTSPPTFDELTAMATENDLVAVEAEFDYTQLAPITKSENEETTNTTPILRAFETKFIHQPTYAHHLYNSIRQTIARTQEMQSEQRRNYINTDPALLAQDIYTQQDYNDLLTKSQQQLKTLNEIL